MDNGSKLEQKIDILDARLDDIDKTLILQHASLEEHIRGVRAAEANLDLLRAQLQPIQKHVAMIEGVLKFVGGAGILITVLFELYKIVKG